jgi:hypothetical protein
VRKNLDATQSGNGAALTALASCNARREASLIADDSPTSTSALALSPAARPGMPALSVTTTLDLKARRGVSTRDHGQFRYRSGSRGDCTTYQLGCTENRRDDGKNWIAVGQEPGCRHHTVCSTYSRKTSPRSKSASPPRGLAYPREQLAKKISH